MGRQPPSGGCVLKQAGAITTDKLGAQPPSGGCVLKLLTILGKLCMKNAAAFGRLCVETTKNMKNVWKKVCSRLRAAVC